MVDETAFDMEADAEAAANADTPELDALVVEASELELEITRLTVELDDKARKLRQLMEHDIPTALNVAGIEGCIKTVGNRQRELVMTTRVIGSLSQARNPEEAIEYLEESGLEGVITSKVEFEFGKGDEKAAIAFGSQTGRPHRVIRTVHPQTLMAFGRVKLEQDPTWDAEKVGLTALPVAKFKR